MRHSFAWNGHGLCYVRRLMRSGEHWRCASHRWALLTNVETTSDTNKLRPPLVAQKFLHWLDDWTNVIRRMLTGPNTLESKQGKSIRWSKAINYYFIFEQSDNKYLRNICVLDGRSVPWRMSNSHVLDVKLFYLLMLRPSSHHRLPCNLESMNDVHLTAVVAP